jgi:hypothetical protein
MRWVCLIAVLVLAVDFAGGQQSGSARASAAATGGQAVPATAGGTAKPGRAPVKVYEPSSTVKEPRLLPLTSPPLVSKNCIQRSEIEVLLSLLVDADGKPRNVMFLKPAGSELDRTAIDIAGHDRFLPFHS